MARKPARQDDIVDTLEDRPVPVETRAECGSNASHGARDRAPVMEGAFGDGHACQGQCAESRASRAVKMPLEPEPDDRRGDSPHVSRRPSPGSSVKFAFRAACYLAGRAAEQLVSIYTRAVTLDRDYITDFNKSGGLAHARRHRWDKAIPLLEKTLTAAPDDEEVRLRLAEAYAAQARYDLACEHLERLLAAAPDSAVALRALGAICVRQQEYGRAIEHLERAVKLDPDHAQTYYRLGIAYDNTKQYEQAVGAFGQAIRLEPRMTRAYQALGFTHESMGHRDLAVECFKKALELE